MASDLEKCVYTDGYNDVKTGEYYNYECDRTSIPYSRLCKFHDDEYYKNNEDDITQSFLSELNSSQSPIFFIGCNIPNIKIKNMTQHAPIYFTNTKFHGDIIFHDIKFNSIDFTSSKIYGKCRFTHVNIDDILLFKKINFTNESNMYKTIFENCTFKTSNFSFTDFKLVKFLACNFIDADFWNTKFGKMEIENCNFKGQANFKECTFDDESKFTFSIFHNTSIFQYVDFSAITKFDNVDFKEQQLVRFNGNLSNVSFLGTDITRIRFDEKIIWGDPDKYLIYDAKKLQENLNHGKLTSILATYRNLRENYEFRLMYEEASQFFIKEMDFKRIYFEESSDKGIVKIPKRKRYLSLINIYNIFCQYGESLTRVVLWISLLFIGSTLYFFICPDTSILEKIKPMGDIDYSKEITYNLWFRIQVSIERTLTSFLQINNHNLFDLMIRIVSLPLFGMSFVVLRRKFERKFRH